METALKEGESGEALDAADAIAAGDALVSADANEAAAPAAAQAKPAAPVAKPEASTFADMRVKVGDRAQLEPPPQMNAGRVTVKVVGWVEGHSLIVTAPRARTGRLVLQAGEHALLRVFTGTSAFAFKSTVLKTSRPPFEYLHLSFPDNIERLEVRSSPRFRVDLPAAITPAGGATKAEGTIRNLSTTGALLEAADPIGNVGEEIRIEFKFRLHGVPTELKLGATIRTTKSADDLTGTPQHQHGVSFNEMPPSDLMILSALVWYEMHEHPRNAV